MAGLDFLFSDTSLEIFRAVVVAVLFAFVFNLGRQTGKNVQRGWSWLTAGFGLLALASFLDVTDNFPELSRYVLIGDTPTQAFLEKVVGYLGGFLALFIGLRLWLPLAVAGETLHADATLQESQQRYRDLVELSPDAIILHRKGQIIYANAAAAELVGLPDPDMLIGKSTMDFVHPDYHNQTRERLQALAGGLDKVPLIHIQILTRGGGVRDVEVSSGLTNFHGEKVFQSVLRDIGLRVRAERALKGSERELRTIFDNMAEFYYRADLDGRIVRASGAAEEVTGWTREDIIGLVLSTRNVDPEGREKFTKALDEAGGSLRNYEAQVVRKDDRRIWVSVNAQYFRDKDGNVAGIEGTVRDCTETVQARDVLEHMAMHDILTGLGNRRSFDSRLKEALPRARRSGIGGAILYFDLDGFKAVNDTYGHDVGDEVLRAVGSRLKHLARETDYVARIGGDEFCLIIEGVADTSASERVAQKVIASLSKDYAVEGNAVTLGVSVGVASFNGHEGGDPVLDLVTRADKVMYEAKSSGGNTYRVAVTANPQAVG